MKRSKRPRRQRKSTLAALKRKLWILVSLYVKQRDGNTCFSCGAEGLTHQGWHAGHLFSAGAHSLVRYHPKNVHSQCFRCNINQGGNGAAYAEHFIETYGFQEFERLSRLAKQMKQWKSHEIEEMIAAIQKGAADYEMLYEERYGICPVA